MRSISLKAMLAAAALAGSYGIASAQVGFGITVGPDYYYDEPSYYSYRYVEPAPRVYSYRRYYSAPGGIDDDELARGSAGGCGTYYFWNGERCVDARNKSGN